MQVIDQIAITESTDTDLEYIGQYRTIREQIFDFFGTKLATMLKANGYNTG